MTGDAAALAAAWASAWNGHDVDAVVAWYAPDGTHRMASGNTYAGTDALRGMVERSLAAYPDLSFTVRGAFTAPDPPAARFALEYTMRGRGAEIDGVLVGVVGAGGRVRSCTDYLDHLALRRRLTPEP